MTIDFNTKHVKILVNTQPSDGYPPEKWEGLWAIPLGCNRFKIDNIPFYAKGLSCDDIIEANEGDIGYIFNKVIQKSDNSTIRVVVYDLEDEQSVRSAISSFNCSIEGTGTPGLIAINVPKGKLVEVEKFLQSAFIDGRIDFEEGALR